MRRPPDGVDVIVVGNGALGLFLADELTRRGVGSVAVVGPRARTAGASQAAGAMLGCFGEVTADTLRTGPGRARFQLGLAAHDRWPDVLQRLDDIAPWQRPLQVSADTFVVLNTAGFELDSVNFAAMKAALDAYGRPWAEVEPCTVAGYNPRMDRRALRAIHLPSEGAVDARRVLEALEACIRRAGVAIVDETVLRLLTSNGVVTGVQLADGHLIEAGTVVVAAGASSEALVRPVVGELDMMPTFSGLGFAMVARRVAGEPFQSVVRTPNRAFACGLHVVPLGASREYLGASNHIVSDVTTIAVLAEVWFLSQCAMQQLGEEIALHEIEQFRTGNRPATLDGFPLVGWLLPSSLYLMTGTYRDGFHCAPWLAVHVANELQGQPGVIDPMYAPRRRPIVTRTVEESIESYVQHSLAAWYETGAQAAPQMTTWQLAQSHREYAMRVYDQLGIDYGLAPDLLGHVAGSRSGDRIKRFLQG